MLSLLFNTIIAPILVGVTVAVFSWWLDKKK